MESEGQTENDWDEPAVTSAAVATMWVVFIDEEPPSSINSIIEKRSNVQYALLNKCFEHKTRKIIPS